jgi:hypothetical protein
MTGVADWIIGDDVENQILGAGIADLMRFTGLKDERVAGFDRCGPINVPLGEAQGCSLTSLRLILRIGLGFAPKRMDNQSRQDAILRLEDAAM